MSRLDEMELWSLASSHVDCAVLKGRTFLFRVVLGPMQLGQGEVQECRESGTFVGYHLLVNPTRRVLPAEKLQRHTAPPRQSVVLAHQQTKSRVFHQLQLNQEADIDRYFYSRCEWEVISTRQKILWQGVKVLLDRNRFCCRATRA